MATIHSCSSASEICLARAVEDDGNGRFVFANANGEPLDPGWQRQMLYAALDVTAQSRFRFHVLRYSAATLLLKKGIHVKLDSELLA